MMSRTKAKNNATQPASHTLRKPKNSDRRAREYLTEHEVNKLIRAAKSVGRHGHRDSTMILMAYRHGLRVSELMRLKWTQVNLFEGLLHVLRVKNGIEATHPLAGVELRALRQLQRAYPQTDFLFISERKAPLTDHTFRKILTRAGEVAHLNFPIHPHMLRHATGFKLANEGNDTRSIQNTQRYTELTPARFKYFWLD